MPGVPSSRGCDACRKQKKKCDQLKPSCSRCARLRINCEGSGQRRYKFKEQNAVLTSTRIQEPQRPLIKVTMGPSMVPSNRNTLLISCFLSALKVTDLRYDLTYYGGFIRDIPRRLGTNDALDASVGVIASAFPSLYTYQQSPEMLEKYGHALKTLRVTLSDPAKAYTTDTLCAIYLLEVCQSWLGTPGDRLTSHGEILAHLLNAAPLTDRQDSFEMEMFTTVCAAVVFESLVNPKIQLDAFFSKLGVILGQTHGPRRRPASEDSGPFNSIKLQNIAGLGKFFQDPHLHILEIKSVYQQLLVDSQRIRRHLALFKESTAVIQTPLQTHTRGKEHVAYQAACGMICALGLVMNCILRIFSPDDWDLMEDAERLSTNIMQLAEDASQYRPTGAAYIPFCLIAAWVAMDGTPKQLELEAVLQDWKADFRSPKWMEMAMWLKRNLEDLRLKVFEVELSSDNCYNLTRLSIKNEPGC